MRILLAIDGSPSSIEARDLVASLSIPGGSSVTLLTAYDIPVAWFGETLAAGGAGLAEAAEAVRREADATLVRLAAPFSGRDWSVERRVVRGRASGVIVEAAADMAADLIVLGSRGHGPIASMLLGSVSAEVVERASCSVLVAQGGERISSAGGNRRIAVRGADSRRAGQLGGIRRAAGNRPQRRAGRLGRLRVDGAPVHDGQPVARTRPPGIARAPPAARLGDGHTALGERDPGTSGGSDRRRGAGDHRSGCRAPRGPHRGRLAVPARPRPMASRQRRAQCAAALRSLCPDRAAGRLSRRI